MTDTLYEYLHTFMATLVSNVDNSGCFGRMLLWLPVLPLFLDYSSYVVAPEAFCSAYVSCRVVFLLWLIASSGCSLTLTDYVCMLWPLRALSYRQCLTDVKCQRALTYTGDGQNSRNSCEIY